MTWEAISTTLNIILLGVSAMLWGRGDNWQLKFLRSNRRASAWQRYANRLEELAWLTARQHTDPGTLERFREDAREESLSMDAFL